VKTLVRGLVWLVVLLRSLRERPAPSSPERIVEPAEPQPRAELAVAGLLLASAAAAVLTVVGYGLAWSTQAFGGALAAALALFAAALVVAGKTFVPTEELDEEYPPVAHPDEQRDMAQIVRESGDRITRKRLLGGAAGLAGGALGAALVVPAVSLGPVFDTSQLNESPWRRGIGLLDDKGRPWLADDIEDGTFYTALPEGADPKAIGAPVILVRIDPAALHLPAGREDWAPEGIVAYSKICTHAGCALALYRRPLYEPTSEPPGIACPCHYSVFDPRTGGTVVSGPAGRELPQLPLEIGPGRELRAGGGFSGPIGPSWWGVRRT